MSFERIDDSAKPVMKYAHDEITVSTYAGGWALESTKSNQKTRLLVTSDYTNITIPEEYINEKPDTECIRQLFRVAYECAFISHNIISLHSACIEYNDRSVAFAGPSGVGKSTRARVWVERLGAEFISGDRPAIRLENDSAVACGVPWDGKEQIFRDVERPLAAILEVRRASFCAMRRLSTSQARKILMQQCFIPMWDNDAAAAAMSVIRRLADSVPIYRLFCGPDGESAEWTCSALFGEGNHSIIKEAQPDMKIKDGFVLRNIVGENIVMPVGENINKFEGALVLNDVSAFLWEKLQAPICREDLLSLLLAEYDVESTLAENDLDAFLDKLRQYDLLQEESA